MDFFFGFGSGISNIYYVEAEPVTLYTDHQSQLLPAKKLNG